MNVPIVRLTSLAHGGGCGCKLAPSVLKELLADQPAAQPYRELLVGTETGDDARAHDRSHSSHGFEVRDLARAEDRGQAQDRIAACSNART